MGVNHDHLRNLTRCHPSVGIAELIWNSLDADARKVRVWLRDGPMSAIDRVEVADDGTGIDITRVDDAFEKLGGSWKAEKKVSGEGRVLHGRAGKGFFRAGSIGRVCHWHTVNRSIDGTVHSFGVTINTDNLTDVEIDPSETDKSIAATGTRVMITGIHAPHSKAFDEDVLKERLTEEFGPYLLQYRTVVIEIQGDRLNPKSLISHQESLILPGALTVNGKRDVQVKLVEWKKQSERRIFLCDSDGTTLTEVPMRSHLLDGYVTGYASSQQFRALNVPDLAEGQVEQIEEIRPVLAGVRQAVKEYVRKRLAARAQTSVQRWKEEAIHPYEGEPSDTIEAVEREVFDIVAVQVDRFLLKFKAAAKTVQKMQFSLLRRALESHPEEVAEMINAFVGLPANEKKLLHDLLQRTTLSNIIRATKIVDERLHFLRGLEEMLADPAESRIPRARSLARAGGEEHVDLRGCLRVDCQRRVAHRGRPSPHRARQSRSRRGRERVAVRRAPRARRPDVDPGFGSPGAFARAPRDRVEAAYSQRRRGDCRAGKEVRACPRG